MLADMGDERVDTAQVRQDLEMHRTRLEGFLEPRMQPLKMRLPKFLPHLLHRFLAP